MTATTEPAALIHGSRRLIAASIGFSAAINLLYFAAPLYFVQVFTRVLTSRSVETLIALSCIIALCILAVGVLEGARAIIVRRAGERVDAAFAPGAVMRAFARPVGAPLTDLDRMARFYGSAQLIALFDLPWVLAFVLALALLHPWFGVLAAAGVATIAALGYAAARSKQAHGQNARPAATRHAESLRNWAGAERLVVAFGLERLLAGRWRGTRETMVLTQSHLADTQAVYAAVARSLRLALQCAAIGLGAVLVLQDSIGPGAMFAASLLMGRTLAPVESGVGALCELRPVSAAVSRLTAPETPAQAPIWRASAAGQGAGVMVERLSCRLPGDGEPILAGLGFTLARGEVLGLVGPSGAGKSALLAVLAGVLPATTGSMRTDLDHATAARPGYLPQHATPLAATPAETIGCGRHRKEAIIAAAAMFDLRATIEALPGRWHAPLDDHAARLPAGVRQRLALARAICGMPRLVLLDEPTAHLDSDGERALLDAVAALKAGGSIVIVASHRPSVLGLADRLLVLAQGRERAQGPRNLVLAELARGTLQAVPNASVKPSLAKV